MGTLTSINRWRSSPTRKQCCSGPPKDSRPHTAAGPARSAAARTPRKSASRGPGSYPRASNAGPVRESLYARASRAERTGTPRYRASSRGKSVGRTPCPILLGTRKALHRVIAVMTRDDPRERAQGRAIHRLREQRLSGVHGRALPGKRVRESATCFKSTPPKIAGKPLYRRHFYAVLSENSGRY